MKENLFEIGAKFDDTWQANNRSKPITKISTEIKEPEKHRLYFAKEKRRGKIVTIVKPFFLEKKSLHELLKTLKKRLGTGGTVKESSLEFQGEVSQQLRRALEKMGYRFKESA
jgi:translation initiation factor 1